MMTNAAILLSSLTLVVLGATIASKQASLLAESFRLSKYVIGFIVIAVISILPETFISIDAALSGDPAFGLGTLFGSNIADLTLIFTILTFAARRPLKVENKILKQHAFYPFILLLPIAFGLNGYFSRAEGALLIGLGLLFYVAALKSNNSSSARRVPTNRLVRILLLLLSMAMLLVGSHFTVEYASTIAYSLGVSPILVGMLVVGLGTTMPELFFSLKSVHHKEDSLAVGDILGTVLADATIVVGLIAVVAPFTFPIRLIYITGVFMVIASFVLFHFMHTGKRISLKEASLLLLFWITFVLTEFFLS